MGDGKELKEQLNRMSSGKASALTVTIALGFLVVAFSYPKFTARGQNYGQSSAPQSPSAPVIHFTPPPPPPVVRPPVVVTTDVTNPQLTAPVAANFRSGVTPVVTSTIQAQQTQFALAGIQVLNDKLFPGADLVGKNFDWITVLAKDGAVYSKINNFTADLKSGEIIVSVKNPSRLAFVKTPYGDIAIGANSDVMISFVNGVLRVLNFDGENRVIKIQLNKGPFGGPADPTVTIAPGYELVASDKVITRAEMRPRDGIARRFGKTLENGHLAISEFSVQSATSAVGMLVNLQQSTTGVKERRIVTDLAKMAAALNYRSGTDGFSVEK
ncbi:MAG: hypothetical protein JSS83_10525 [Cyanobacteria bacterium SZAS LIN-3]|nr:hypothetical protein [Cyanobacteria bacterium SZAS LIN-3]